MDNIIFTPLEETISFYTRNDFAIMNHFLVGNFDDLWRYAFIAYNDNKGILNEYEKGVRSIDSDYDIKWINCLKKRLINDLDDNTKAIIINNAKNDIANILNAMYPAEENMLLYRTAWIDKRYSFENYFAYSREYKALQFNIGSIIEIRIISSYSLTPYREKDDVGSDFYRYEIVVPRGMPILELDRFISHNEDGEVLLPPMRCKVIDICTSKIPKCKGVIKLEYISDLKKVAETK